MSEFNITVNGTARLKTAGKYCDRDIVVKSAAVEDHSVEDSLVTRGLTSYTNDRIKSVGGQAFWGCSSLTEVCLPNVEALATNSFRACTKLVKVDLGSKARTINSNAFYGCTKLNAVIIRSESVCSCTTSTFTDTPIEDGTGFVYVPSALVESYKATSNWKNFNIRAIEDYPDICG